MVVAVGKEVEEGETVVSVGRVGESAQVGEEGKELENVRVH